MKKFTLFAGILLATAFLSRAQNTPYQFVNTSGTYTDLANPTLLSSTVAWDDEVYAVPLGFNFQYINQSYDTVYVNTYGYLAFDVDEEVLFSGFMADLADRGYNTSGNSLSPVSYKVIGTAGNRSFIVEFKNTSFYSDASGTDYVNLQMWLNEVDNSVEVHVGPVSVQTPATAYDGSSGPMVGVAQVDPTFTTSIYSLMLEGNPASPTTTTLNMSTLNYLTGTPSNGQIYRFVPFGVGMSEYNSISSVSIYPNPLTDASVIEMNIQQDAHVNIAITDVTGRLISDIVDTELGAGAHQFKLNTSGLAEGIYFAKVTAGEKVTLHKMIVSNH
jgi:hypothetical protein